MNELVLDALNAGPGSALEEFGKKVRAALKPEQGGRPFSPNPRKLISLRLPADVIARWKATGPGWQTRMADRLSKVR